MRFNFNVYRDGASLTLAQGDIVQPGFASEAAAADMAVRIAQDHDALYAISYWRAD